MSESGARCPGCNVCFRITASQRRAAGGQVRCGFCLTVFDANAQSLDLAAAPAPAARPRPDRDSEPPPALPAGVGSMTGVLADPEADGAAGTIPEPGPALDAPGGESPAQEPEPEIAPAAALGPELPEPDPEPQSATGPESAASSPPGPVQDIARPAAPEAETAAPAPPPGPGPGAAAAPAPELEAEFTPAAAGAAGVADAQAHQPDAESPAEQEAVGFGAAIATGPESAASAPPPWLLPAGSRPRGKRAAAAVALVALGVLLLQGLYFYADLLAERPELHGVYRILCRAAPCRRPPYRDVATIAVDQLAVRAQGSGALRLDAMLSNRGRAAQPLPSVRLRFENLQGEVIAVRRFAPDEYLDRPQPGALAVGQSLHLVLELVDPGPDAVSYSLTPAD